MRDEFMITRQGKQYVLFAGLLDEAHSRGLKGIDTDLVQVPEESNGNVAVVKATVQMEDGRTFSGIGDASPDNVGRNIVPHLMRMAETRAKARALRDAVNVSATALEELSDGDDAPPAGGSSRGASDGAASGRSAAGKGRTGPREVPQSAPQEAAPAAPPAAEPEQQGPSAVEGNGAKASEGAEKPAKGGSRGGSAKARNSQVELLRTLAEELRGENGVQRLEGRIGKTLSELSRAEADEWIDKLTPSESES
ncbi:MAG: hypothetical protein H0V53_06590 [Rubrobacter sp.]|nr:hypothetical protein [Rubrobacter sp.]